MLVCDGEFATRVRLGALRNEVNDVAGERPDPLHQTSITSLTRKELNYDDFRSD